MCCDVDMSFEAIENGHLECLKRAYKNKCVWNKEVCKHAVGYWQLDCLKFAHENDCPWDEDLCDYAEDIFEIRCLEYIIKNYYTYKLN